MPASLRSFIGLAVTSGTSQLVRLVTGVVNARLLTPVLYATSASATVVVRYASFTQMGIQNGLNRELPIRLGHGDPEGAHGLASTAFWAITGVALGLCVLGGFMTVKQIPITDALPPSYYPEVTLLAVTTLYTQFFISLTVSRQRYGTLTRVRLAFETLLPIAGVAAVVIWRVHGLLLAQAVFGAGESVVCARALGFIPALRLSGKELWFLLRSGAPILLSSVVAYTFLTVDFIYVSRHFGRMSVGLYGFALTCSGFFNAYVIGLSDVLGPKIGYHFGAENQNPASLARFAGDYTFVFVAGLAILTTPFFFGIPILVRVLLPSYEGSLGAFRFLILANYALAAYVPCGHIVTVLRKQTQFMAMTAAAIVVSTGAFYLLVGRQMTLSRVALIWLIVSTGLSACVIVYSSQLVGRAWALSRRAIPRSLAAMTFFIVLYAAVGTFERDKTDLIWVATEIAKLALVLACATSVLFLGDPRNPIVQRLKVSFQRTPTQPKAET